MRLSDREMGWNIAGLRYGDGEFGTVQRFR